MYMIAYSTGVGKHYIGRPSGSL